ncbi:2,4-dienoyl-CoA reductase [Nitzschia inconspicua]|uniref:2,4-dienoyl-CoA reductase n=1 Tax=Nitzschia inconspicua TaxID=303405 RepID=A0A9K3KQ52_9STRA|nr:2,4-dienoyl-CoA reductase [Nitzschia inconspicua]
MRLSTLAKQQRGRILRNGYNKQVSSTSSSQRSLSSPAFSNDRYDASVVPAASKHPLYPNLFAPLTLSNGKVVANRVLMGSMHTGLEGTSMPQWMERLLMMGENNTSHHQEHHSLDRMATYFQRRAQGGVGLMVTGGIAPNYQGWVGPYAAQLTTHDEMVKHQVVTQAVHDVQVPIYGTNETTSPLICLQILHAGRYAYHPWAVSASATQSPISPFKAKALTKPQLQQTIDDFVNTAVLAQQAGYDGVELMGSEGYLISQFLSPHTNLRTDDYGGDSFENRSRFPLELVQAVRKATGEDFVIIFRISLLDLVQQSNGGMTWEESVTLARRLQDAGVTILNTGIGWHESRVPTIATNVPRGAFTFCTKKLRETLSDDIPIVSTNRINAPDTAELVLSEGVSDLVSMARPLLADPNFLQKAYNQQADHINTCIACNQACLDHAFVGKTASCLVNPAACHEDELTPFLLPEADRLNIGVIGAGPAGCAFSIAAAQMGHTVTLYDKGDKVGGQFHMAKRIPGKEEFNEALRYFQVQLEKQGVNIQMNTEISLKEMQQQSHVDKWIVATGVNPRDPKIPGQDHPHVLSYIDVLKHNAPVGESVAVIGAGGIGFDVSEYLLYHHGHDKNVNDVNVKDFWEEWGVDETLSTRGGMKTPHLPHPPRRRVHLMQRKKGKLGAGLGRTTGWIHRASLKMGKTDMINGVSYDSIDADGNLHYTKDGKQYVLEVDNIVFCAGQVEEKTLELKAAKVDGLKDKVYTIGGAFMAGELDAKRAIDMGTRLALAIHLPNVTPGNHVFQSPKGTEEKLFELLKKWA